MIEINQTCALNGGCFSGDGAGFPITINVAGSYRYSWGFDLGSNCRIVDNITDGLSLAIKTGNNCVVSGNVVGNGDTGGGEPAVVVGDDCLVEGNVIGASEEGLVAGDRATLIANTVGYVTDGFASILTGADSMLARNVVQFANVAHGIYAGSGSVITNNTVSGIASALAGSSIYCNGGGCVINGNSSRNNFNASGIQCGSGASDPPCLVVGNVSNNNTLVGFLDSATGSGHKENQFDNNNGGNANPQVTGGIEIGANVCGGDTACP